ncbi:hypothetical protein HUG15_07985 [Salicibibacter cibarius]|uniref:Uncharacterized protein n=1 Tax=Salicibibacter cibarius TaxID=2743000 RepID=A0A7T6Z203_9BACI|nr:hypothetical protein [Salicibibacter cibarius]QQK75525.1 hypothetical protein HUG15_07985 [Salicibibacter cibarius]
MNRSSFMKWVTGGLEAFWALPVIGGSIIFSMSWSPLVVMLILHIITLIISINEGRNKHGSILGIVTSAVGFIPFLGWMMHTLTAILLLVDAYRSEKAIEVS